ncbi:MAG: L-histidine N(alpha)-methyltransferase [Bacteroidota bacterium]
MTTTTELNTKFAEDVLEGLRADTKYLSSRYFYDSAGDKLFQQIMDLEEYYLTRAELQVFETHKKSISEVFGDSFRLIELGAGDGLKTKVLLKQLMSDQVHLTYSPVDISGEILIELEKSITAEIPRLQTGVLVGDYFHVMHDVVYKSPRKNVVLFLGSNIGNYEGEVRSEFLRQLHQNLNVGDLVLIGFDLKKDPSVILDAYHDKKGITAAFNKNLLHRINREFAANFNVDMFQHYPSYNPQTGECRSYLLSTAEQKIEIPMLDAAVEFRQWETILMEISKKFDIKEIDDLARQHGFIVESNFQDDKNWFVDSIWRVQ